MLSAHSELVMLKWTETDLLFKQWHGSSICGITVVSTVLPHEWDLKFTVVLR